MTAHRILVVEDEPSAAQLYKRWLQSAGHDVTVAPTAENAFARISQDRRWDMVFTDVELPGRSGLDLIRQIKDTFPRLPVMLTSGHRSTDIASAAVASGALGFLLKPFDKSTLLDRVDFTFNWLANSKVVLAIGATPHCVELGCGGTLLRHRQAGRQVRILPLWKGPAAAEVAEHEAGEAASALGVSLLPDALREPLPQDIAAISEKIQQVIRECSPTWIYTHCAEDTHPLHRLIHKATLAVAEKVPQVYAYQSQSITPNFHPDHFVEIEKVLPRKQAALKAYESLMASRPFLQPDMVRASAVYWGRFAGYRLVEPFKVAHADPENNEQPF